MRNGVTRCCPGEVLADVGFAVLSGASAEITSRVAGGPLRLTPGAVKGIWAEGADGNRYALIANFGPDTQSVEVCGATTELAGGTAAVRAMTAE